MPVAVGFCAGVLAWFLMLSQNSGAGFVATTILGVLASITSALFGEAAGLFEAADSAPGSALGAAFVLLIWAAVSGLDRGTE